MKVYLAARYSRREEMNAVALMLNKLGYCVTSRWINGNHHISDEGLSDEAANEDRARFATEDLEDLLCADCCIAFTEKPRSAASRGVRHVEFGIALGRGLRCVVIGPRENVFCCLDVVEHYRNFEEFYSSEAWLRQVDRPKNNSERVSE